MAFEGGLGFFQGALVSPGREVFPSAIAHDERDVGPLAGLDRLVRQRDRGVQRAAGGDAREDALLLQQVPRTAQGVARADGEPGGEGEDADIVSW